jgi:hypothetical protein
MNLREPLSLSSSPAYYSLELKPASSAVSYIKGMRTTPAHRIASDDYSCVIWDAWDFWHLIQGNLQRAERNRKPGWLRTTYCWRPCIFDPKYDVTQNVDATEMATRTGYQSRPDVSCLKKICWISVIFVQYILSISPIIYTLEFCRPFANKLNEIQKLQWLTFHKAFSILELNGGVPSVPSYGLFLII